MKIANKLETKTCCICGKSFNGYGHNPYPLKDEGVCCNECNVKVIEARVKEYGVVFHKENGHDNH